jgi:hypothetical protein
MTNRIGSLFAVAAVLMVCCRRVLGRAVEAGAAMDNIYQVPGPSESPATSNAYRAGLQGIQPPGYGQSTAVAPMADGEARAALNGTPTISDTYNPRDQGTDWPPDAFTQLVSGHVSPEPIARPALHSYAGDGNMESISVFGPFTRQEDRHDLAAYTGAVGPAGGSTPESHPELTAP